MRTPKPQCICILNPILIIQMRSLLLAAGGTAMGIASMNLTESSGVGITISLASSCLATNLKSDRLYSSIGFCSVFYKGFRMVRCYSLVRVGVLSSTSNIFFYLTIVFNLIILASALLRKVQALVPITA